MIRVELAQARNMGNIVTLELRTQEYPKLAEEIKEHCLTVDGGKQAHIASIATKIVGYVLTAIDKETSSCIIESIGVHQEFRKSGVGRALVDKVTEGACKRKQSLKIRVASYAITDTEDPWCIEHWLWRLGFKAIGCDGECFRYGRNYDIYLFERLR